MPYTLPVDELAAQGPAPSVPPPSSGRGVLLAILALSAILRLVGFTSFPLWQDEQYTMAEATELFDSPNPRGVLAKPLYLVLHHVLSFVLPATPAGFRIAPLVFGLAGIWVTWMIGARLVGRTAALVGALLLAIAPSHIFMSQTARYYTLLYLLAALSSYLVLKAYEGDRPRDYGAALLALLGSVLVHPIALLPVGGIALACTLVTRSGHFGWMWPSRRAWAYLWGPLSAAIVVGYGTLIAVDAFFAPSAAPRSTAGTLRLLPALVQLLTPTVVVAAALGALLLARAESLPSLRRWGMMTLLGCGTGCLLLLIGARFAPFYSGHAIAMLPLMFVAAGALVQVARNRMTAGRRTFDVAAVALLSAGVLPSTVSYLSDGSRFDYRPAFQAIRVEAPQLAVLTWPLVDQQYYAPELRARELPEDGSTQVLDSVLSVERQFWVVASIRRYGLIFDEEGRRARWLQSHCRRTMSHERPRFDYQLFRVELYRCGDEPASLQR